MKTLIILAHPNIENSLVNRHWRDAVLAHPDKFELHDLYALYADFKIDVEKEQKLLESHDKIFSFRFVFQTARRFLSSGLRMFLRAAGLMAQRAAASLKAKNLRLRSRLARLRQTTLKMALWALA